MISSSNQSLSPTNWCDWSKTEIKEVVKDLRTQYVSSKADGFIITMGKENRVEAVAKERFSSEEPLTMPGPDCEGSCSLCHTTNHHVEMEDDFRLLRSLSGRALIIKMAPEQIKPSWVTMDVDAQVEMVMSAQKAMKAIADLPGIDIANSSLSLHCGKNAKQTVSHTHLRINNIAPENGGNPTIKMWDQIIERVGEIQPKEFSTAHSA